MNLKFWEWFKKNKTTATTDPFALETLKEYQKAVGVERTAPQRLTITGSGAQINADTTKDISSDMTIEDAKRKYRHGIHQTTHTNAGVDTLSLNGVRAVGEEGSTITVIAKVDKSKLYELGYDIREESDQMVQGLGFISEEVAVPDDVKPEDAERYVLEQHGITTSHYSGKPQDRPVELYPNTPEEVARESEEVPASVERDTNAILKEIERTTVKVADFHAKAMDHALACPLYDHFMHHIDEQTGDVFDCCHVCSCDKVVPSIWLPKK